MPKQLLFSVTAKDCDWSYTRGSGKGGQKRNKTSTAVHCKHRASGAYGYSDDTRSQHKNKATAFTRMAQDSKFETWRRLETARRTGEQAAIGAKVEREMRQVKVEFKENGKWVEQLNT